MYMNLSRRIGIFTFLLFGVISGIKAQEGVELGGHIGVSHYFGDLNTNYSLAHPGLSFGIKARRNFNERMSLTGAIDYARISGSDENAVNVFQQKRNLSFYSNILDFSGVLEFNFFPYIHGSEDDYYTPYIYGGISFTTYNPKAELNGQNYTLRDFGTEGQFDGNEYGLMSMSLAFGAGIKWDINRDWSINVQLNARKPFSDYIDDVSQSYPDFTTLRNQRGAEAVLLSNRSPDPDFARAGLQRGNGKNNDIIYFLNIGIMRYIGQLHCPAISKDFY